ncbi:hypothetical protein BESB_067420 [Besnoitia besnoiti]|uniref:Uncharacterized protein n=1 Tax=Besnoitia besnoiti TaxID=94643 RepID=A0A2A9M9Y2_BESBE|nr:hypothetical protein BESB_067420 [Besnoitia besnoiti]PFH34709.1 hypothetical protein BESB_067420 [Besnoitia besnoiti]
MAGSPVAHRSAWFESPPTPAPDVDRPTAATASTITLKSGETHLGAPSKVEAPASSLDIRPSARGLVEVLPVVSVREAVRRGLFGLMPGKNPSSPSLPSSMQISITPHVVRGTDENLSFTCGTTAGAGATKTFQDTARQSGESVARRHSVDYHLPTVPLSQAVADSWPHTTPATPFQSWAGFGSGRLPTSSGDTGTAVPIRRRGTYEQPSSGNTLTLQRRASLPVSIAEQPGGSGAFQGVGLPLHNDGVFKAVTEKHVRYAKTSDSQREGGMARSLSGTALQAPVESAPRHAAKLPGGRDIRAFAGTRDAPFGSVHQHDVPSQAETVEGGPHNEGPGAADDPTLSPEAAEKPMPHLEAAGERKFPLSSLTPPDSTMGQSGEGRGRIDKAAADASLVKGNSLYPCVFVAYDEQPRVCVNISPTFQPQVRVRRSSAPSVQIFTDLPMAICQCFQKPVDTVTKPARLVPAWLRGGAGRADVDAGSIEGAERVEHAQGPQVLKPLESRGPSGYIAGEQEWLWHVAQPTILIQPATSQGSNRATGYNAGGQRGRGHQPFVVVDVTTAWWPTVQLQYVDDEQQDETADTSIEAGSTDVQKKEPVVGPGICVWSQENPGCVDQRLTTRA